VPEAGDRGERLVSTFDAINDRFGRDTHKFAACGIKQDWLTGKRRMGALPLRDCSAISL